MNTELTPAEKFFQQLTPPEKAFTKQLVKWHGAIFEAWKGPDGKIYL